MSKSNKWELLNNNLPVSTRRELDKYFVEYPREKALKLFERNFRTVFGIDYQGSDSVLECTEDFDRFSMFAVEREMPLGEE